MDETETMVGLFAQEVDGLKGWERWDGLTFG